MGFTDRGLEVLSLLFPSSPGPAHFTIRTQILYLPILHRKAYENASCRPAALLTINLFQSHCHHHDEMTDAAPKTRVIITMAEREVRFFPYDPELVKL